MGRRASPREGQSGKVRKLSRRPVSPQCVAGVEPPARLDSQVTGLLLGGLQGGPRIWGDFIEGRGVWLNM